MDRSMHEREHEKGVRRRLRGREHERNDIARGKGAVIGRVGVEEIEGG